MANLKTKNMRVFLSFFLIFQLITNIAYTKDNLKLVESNKEFLIQTTLYSSDVPMYETKRLGFIKYHRLVKYPIVSWYKILISKDTLIDNQKYFSIIQTSTNRVDSGLFLREDSNKVFLLDKSQQIIELYDFNININDTIADLICSRIDTIINVGIKRPRIILNQCCLGGEEATWIYGLGNMKEIIYHDYGKVCGCKSKLVGHKVGGGISDSKLIRVTQDNKIVYLDSNYNNFDFKNIGLK